jgi:sialic acid synthase SpsE
MDGVRKSLVATTDIKKGEKIIAGNIDVKRPLGGIQPRYYKTLIENNTIATKAISADDHITEENTSFSVPK